MKIKETINSTHWNGDSLLVFKIRMWNSRLHCWQINIYLSNLFVTNRIWHRVSFFNQSKAGWIQFSFSWVGNWSKSKEPTLLFSYNKQENRCIRAFFKWINFIWNVVSSRIWTLVTDSISYDDTRYTKRANRYVSLNHHSSLYLFWFLYRLFHAKAILAEGELWYFLTRSSGYKRVHTFPNGINLKASAIARLEFELVYYDVAVQHMSHYTTITRLFFYPFIPSQLWSFGECGVPFIFITPSFTQTRSWCTC